MLSPAVSVVVVTDDEVIDVLIGCGYQRHAIRHVHSGPDIADVIVVPLNDEDDWYSEWQTLRRLVPETGRWPLATKKPFRYDGTETMRSGFPLDGPDSASALLAAAQKHDPDDLFRSYEPVGAREDMAPLDSMLDDLWSLDDELKKRWRTDALRELGPSPSLRESEQWLVRTQIAEQVLPKTHPDLYPNDDFYASCVALIPDPDPINGLAYFATSDSEPLKSLPVCRRWQTDHNVELIGISNAGHLFEMPEPIADPDQAWRLAVELLEIWPFGYKANVYPIHLAPFLTTSTRFSAMDYL